jgi:hypothetical protein
VDWKALIIPLIPLAIWIIVSIFRAREEAKEDQQPEPDESPKRPTQQPARRMLSDRERFEQQAQARRTVSRANREQPAKPPRADELPRAVPAAAPRARRAEPAGPPVLLATPVVPASTEPDPAPPVPPAAVPKVARPVSPFAERLRAMLLDRDTLKTAVLLQEILGPPVSRRRGPWGGS